MKVRGFWSDPDGWSLADVVTVLVLPVWMYVKNSCSGEVRRRICD